MDATAGGGMTLFSGHIRSELNDGSAAPLPLLQSDLAPSHRGQTDRNGNEHFESMPSDPDAISANVIFRNFIDMDRQAHTRLTAESPPSDSHIIPNLEQCALATLLPACSSPTHSARAS